jgi:hypothetical protein
MQLGDMMYSTIRPASFQVYGVQEIAIVMLPLLKVFKVACVERSSPCSGVYNQPTSLADGAVMITGEMLALTNLNMRSNSRIYFANIIMLGQHLLAFLVTLSELLALIWHDLSAVCCLMKAAIGYQCVRL